MKGDETAWQRMKENQREFNMVKEDVKEFKRVKEKKDDARGCNWMTSMKYEKRE